MPSDLHQLNESISNAPRFANKSAREVVSCRVCGRTLLIGERSVGFFTLSGEGPYDVCELCVPKAGRYGLKTRQSNANEIARANRGSLLTKVASTVRSFIDVQESTSKKKHSRKTTSEDSKVHGTAVVAAAAAIPKPSGPLAGFRTRRAKAAVAAVAPLDPFALGAVPVGAAAVPISIAAFNQSPHARTLAGLYRTLGEPRANAQPRSSTDREVIITIAWEIVWYQYRVMPDGIEKQSGQYLNELSVRWQNWNCKVHTDGTVHEINPNGAKVDDSGHQHKTGLIFNEHGVEV